MSFAVFTLVFCHLRIKDENADDAARVRDDPVLGTAVVKKTRANV